METSEVIHQQMEETRASLGEKIEKLEEQVLSTVQETTNAVTETVETVKEAVENTVTAVSDTVEQTVETVRHTFDFQQHVENYPWAMFAGAVLVGLVGTQLLTPSSPPAATVPSSAPPPNPSSSVQGSSSSSASAETGPNAVDSAQSGSDSTLASTLEKLKGLAIGTTAGVIGDMLLASAPVSLRDALMEVIDQITTSLGGKPIHGFAGDQEEHQNEPHEKSEKSKESHNTTGQHPQRLHQPLASASLAGR